MIDPVFAMATLDPAKSTAAPTSLPTILPNPDVYVKINDSGVTVLWVVFIVMLVSSAAFSLLAFTVPLGKRLYHFITAMITIFAAISYFAMATGSGAGYAKYTKTHHHKHTDDTHQDFYRQIFWARYVDWSLTTPLLLLDLGLLAGMSGGHIIMAIVADIIMILTGLFAAFPTSGAQKWGWYAIACVAFLVVIWHLALNGRKSASAHGKAGTLYVTLATYTVLIWTAYPIIWGLGEGGRVINPTAEVVAYAILDILAKPIFGFWLLFAHRQLSETNIDIGGFWTNGISREGAVRLEDDDGA